MSVTFHCRCGKVATRTVRKWKHWLAYYCACGRYVGRLNLKAVRKKSIV